MSARPLVLWVAVVLAWSLDGPGTAAAAVGDQVHQVTVPVSGADTFCSIGLAFDGESLYYDRCNDQNIYRIDPLTGALEDTFATGIAENPNCLAFDATRNGLWVGAQSCNVQGMPIYFWDFDDDSVTLEFTISGALLNPATGEPFVAICFCDGLAFNANQSGDPSDDELWFSDDINRNIGLFRPDGTFVNGYDATTVDPSLSTASGLAIGGQNLYLANDGGGDVFRADKTADPLTPIDQFTSGDARQEDMECDPVTFAPTEVMWVRTTPQGGQFPDVVTAYEIEPGTCALGGGTRLTHFQCYEMKPPPPFDRTGLTLVDQFGTTQADVRKTYALCAPADKNGENPSAAAEPGHLTSYGVRPAARFLPVRNQEVVNQFGSLFLDVVKPARLMVPTVKSLAGPPSSPIGSMLDHFQCYKARRARGAARFQKVFGVSVTTQFETATVDLVRPLRLCAQVDKNGENPGAEAHRDHLLCYRAKGAGGLEPTRVYLDNQFGQQSYLISQRREFCVPSLKNPPPTTTSTTSTTTTSTSSTTTTTQPLCGNGLPDPGEQCDPPGDVTCPPISPGGAFLECRFDCTCPSCSHDKCVMGPPLDPSCDPCVASICAADPFCCDVFWNGICLNAIFTVCGQSCGECGDGLIQPGETCDPPGTPGGCPVGQLCNGDCTGCVTLCGNGVIDPGETCDPAAVPSGCAAGEVCTNGCTMCVDPALTVCCDGVLGDSCLSADAASCQSLGQVGPPGTVCGAQGQCEPAPGTPGDCCENPVPFGCGTGPTLTNLICSAVGGTVVPNAVCGPSGDCSTP